jgi:hypothetical protein
VLPLNNIRLQNVWRAKTVAVEKGGDMVRQWHRAASRSFGRNVGVARISTVFARRLNHPARLDDLKLPHSRVEAAEQNETKIAVGSILDQALRQTDFVNETREKYPVQFGRKLPRCV